MINQAEIQEDVYVLTFLCQFLNASGRREGRGGCVCVITRGDGMCFEVLFLQIST